MRDFFATTGGIIMASVVIVGLILGGTYGYIDLYRDAAPRMADAERETYQNSASYVQGKSQLLAKYKREYASTKTAEDKAAIKELALHEAATVDREKLPADVRGWLRDLEANK